MKREKMIGVVHLLASRMGLSLCCCISENSQPFYLKRNGVEITKRDTLTETYKTIIEMHDDFREVVTICKDCDFFLPTAIVDLSYADELARKYSGNPDSRKGLCPAVCEYTTNNMGAVCAVLPPTFGDWCPLWCPVRNGMVKP